MQFLVSIDIETTGLSEERDSIIEIGAVKFKGHRVEAEWTSLINPGKHIPEFISGLTGITDADAEFIGECARQLSDALNNPSSL
jgi:DNA polymerase III epsilon subunit-like protein